MTMPAAPMATPPAPPTKQPNWFARHKVLTGIGAFFLVVGIGSAAAGGSDNATAKQEDSSSSSSTGKTDSKSETKTNTATTDSTDDDKGEAKEGLQADGKTWIYGDWKITNVKIANAGSFLDMFKISSDVTYMGDDTSGGDKCFDLTLDKGDRQVASGSGCASSVRPGKTTTLEFLTGDDYVKGPYEITINKTW